MRLLLCLGVATRILLLLIAAWQDAYLDVKFTDIDYNVYTDAAKHVLQGGSPYDRPTYRYTPIIAWLLLPNHLLFGAWGKVLFCTADIAVAYLGAKYYKVRPVRRLSLSNSAPHPCAALCAFRERMASPAGHVPVALQPLHRHHQRTWQLRVASRGPHRGLACPAGRSQTPGRRPKRCVCLTSTAQCTTACTTQRFGGWSLRRCCTGWFATGECIQSSTHQRYCSTWPTTQAQTNSAQGSEKNDSSAFHLRTQAAHSTTNSP